MRWNAARQDIPDGTIQIVRRFLILPRRLARSQDNSTLEWRWLEHAWIVRQWVRAKGMGERSCEDYWHALWWSDRGATFDHLSRLLKGDEEIPSTMEEPNAAANRPRRTDINGNGDNG